MKTYAIIPSGGVGKRSNAALPKQYIKFCGKELIAYTLEVFQNSECVDEIIVAAQKEFIPLLESIKEIYSLTKLNKIILGGQERQNSVFNALKSINANDDDIIAVHDAVRPLLSQNILTNSVSVAKEFGASVVAIRAKDTLIKGNDATVEYIDRSDIYYAQTPQVFRYKIIYDAMKKAEEDNFIGTDESMLVHRNGFNVKIVDGSSLNFKITTEEDIKLFTLLSDNILCK